MRKSVDTHVSGIKERIASVGEPLRKVFTGLPGAAIVGKAMSGIAGGMRGIVTGLGRTLSGLTKGFSGVGLALSGIAAVAFGAVTAIAALAAAVVAAGVAWVGFGVANMQGLENLAKASRSLNITTEALSGFQHAAAVSGDGAESMTGALQALKSNLLDASLNGGEAARALSRLGLDATALQRGGVDVALEQIADGLQQIGNSAERAHLAAAIGVGGIMSTLRGGSAGMRAALQDAQRLGVTVTAKQAEAAEKANQAWRRAKEGLLGLGRTAAITVTPYIEILADAIAKVLEWVNKYKDDITSFGEKSKFVFSNFSDYVNLYFNKALLAITKFFNTITHYITNVLPQALKSMWDVIKGGFSDEAIDAALEKVKASMKREVGGIEAQLQIDVDNIQKKLDKELKKFNEEKSRVTDKKKEPPPGFQQYQKNSAVERGSAEAFSIIAGSQRDKMYGVANKQLAELSKIVQLLKTKEGRQQLRKAKL